ncbi:MAG: universal stress protein [Geminicoccaceae bacterium]
MAVKDLLVLVDSDTASRRRMEYALDIAARFDARVTALALIPHPYVPAMIGVHIPADLVEAQVREGERAAEHALQAAEAVASGRGRPLVPMTASGSVEVIEQSFVRAAHLADLCVVGQPDEASIAFLAETAFLRTGRPAIVVPAVGAKPGPARCTMVAWNGSREAARAVHDALPFLIEAERTIVLSIDGPAAGTEASGSDLAAHLARHGVRAEVSALPSGGLTVGDAILARAADESADLLVMGGYGRSRMRELILGGATRQILTQMTLPTLLSH